MGLLWATVAVGQAQDSLRIVAPDSLAAPADTLRTPVKSVRPLPGAGTPDTPNIPSTPRKDPIRFSARDSLVIEFDTEDDVGTLAGEAQVAFGDGSLTAHQIQLYFGRSELRASGPTGAIDDKGRPELKQGQEVVKGRTLTYNLDTRRGRLVGVQSAVKDGYVYGAVSKQAADSVIYVQDAMYTTCNHPGDPHYHIRASKMKIVGGKWIYTGPLHVRVFNVPLPLWLPFGFLPAQEGRRSGPLPPNYGEDERGFYLRDFGWYQAINDYMDAQVRFGIWTSGSFQLAPSLRYNRRYLYNGQVSVDWLRERRGRSLDPDFTQRSTWSLRLNHNQTLNPTSSLTASVDFSTSSYLRTVSRQYNDNVRQTIGSNVNYSKRWTDSGRSLSLFASQRQQLGEAGQVTLSLPQFSFRQQTRTPFKRNARGAGERWYEKLNYGYTFNLNNDFSFRPDTSLAGSAGIEWYDALWSGKDFEAATGLDAAERFNFKATHRLPIGATFTFPKFQLNLTPNLQYSEDWYLRTERRALDDSTGQVVTNYESGFTPIRQVSTGVSANTEFYGTFPFKVGAIDGFRHVVRPSVSFSFSPDYAGGLFNYFRSYTDAQGNAVQYPIVRGLSSGKQQNIGLRLGNVFQGRQVKVDSTGDVQRTILQLFTMDLNSTYNAARDSLRWSPVSMSARTSLRNNQVSLNLTGQFSPYALSSEGRTLGASYYGSTGRPLRLTSIRMTATTRFSSNNRGRQQRPFAGSGSQFGQGYLETDGSYVDPFDGGYNNTPVGYADFAIPWSLNLDLTYSLSKPALTTTRRAVLNTGFDFNLTPNWKVQGRSGYDFIQHEVVTTNLSILRDFHDWQMSLNWSPFGQFQSFQFDLHLKTGPLRDILRLRSPKSDIRNRF